MKFCRICGEEFCGIEGARDGENVCRSCADATDARDVSKVAKVRANRKAREEALRSCGLVKVRGACGGTYWE